MDLDEDCIDSWQLYLNELKIICVRILASKDTLMCAKSKSSGMYTTMIGYEVLMNSVCQEEILRWSKIWKIKAPKKLRIFLWLVLRNKALT